ncbi:MAG: HAMP domain-containing sensor histidine kinase [Sphingomonadaceae bacterium]
MRLLGSLSFRLALIYAFLFAISTALTVGGYYLLNIRNPMGKVRSGVQVEAAMLAGTYVTEGQEALVRELQERQRSDAERKPFHAFIAPDGKTIIHNLPGWPEYHGAGWQMIEADLYVGSGESDHFSLTWDRKFNDGARLLVGRDVEDLLERQEFAGEAAAWMLVSALLLGIPGGALLSLAIGRRIDTISATARRVMAGDLSGRIPLQGSNDDFDRLAETLNLMLARIEELLVSIRRLSDSVAHELRTPLARLSADLSELETADADTRPQLTRAALDEADKLIRLFDMVLRIARIEGLRHATSFGEVDLSALATDAIEFYQPAIEERELRLDVRIEPGRIIVGDGHMLAQAIGNLLDNAIKYTPPGGRIALHVLAVADAIELHIVDSGPGIPPDQRERVWGRFIRLAETAHEPGTGLGLPFVKAVADVHETAINLYDAGPGLHVVWKFPQPK